MGFWTRRDREVKEGNLYQRYYSGAGVNIIGLAVALGMDDETALRLAAEFSNAFGDRPYTRTATGREALKVAHKAVKG